MSITDDVVICQRKIIISSRTNERYHNSRKCIRYTPPQWPFIIGVGGALDKLGAETKEMTSASAHYLGYD